MIFTIFIFLKMSYRKCKNPLPKGPDGELDRFQCRRERVFSDCVLAVCRVLGQRASVILRARFIQKS